jgi:hypothetical protein
MTELFALDYRIPEIDVDIPLSALIRIHHLRLPGTRHFAAKRLLIVMTNQAPRLSPDILTRASKIAGTINVRREGGP